ncbi:MAG: PD40 domain-containing protein, partial [Saprospiraceae bacterium]|nr:PD40 domain-containing protein [Saprospiraceae bacterium]
MRLRLIRFLLFAAGFWAWVVPLAAQLPTGSAKDRYRKNTSVVRVRNVREINSSGTDYSPAFYKDGIVFVSARQKSGAYDSKTKETFFELYYSAFDVTEERWPTPPTKFSLEVNSSLHEGPVCFDRSFKHMFFTRNNSKKGVQKADAAGKVRLKIFEAKKGMIDWEDLRELPFNSDSFSCMHPSLSADGRVLYFASDRPGGYGGADIWKVTRSTDGRSWGKPENLGPDVNTSASEVFPFIHVSGTLFFASNGHNTLGGLDLFFYEKDEKGEYVVTNLGEPFNT